MVEFDGGQLGSSGSPVPRVSLTPTDFEDPVDLAFDGSGDLWAPLAPFPGTSQVAELSAGQLASSASPVPAVVLSPADPAPINEPDGMALDAEGDLWVANAGGGGPGHVHPGPAGQRRNREPGGGHRWLRSDRADSPSTRPATSGWPTTTSAP